MKSLIKRNLFILSIVMLISACCPTDYTPKIKKIMVPMSENLKLFFKENSKYPNDEERDILVEKSGCEVIDAKKRICIFNSQEFKYESNIELSRKDYFFAIAKKGSHCYINMTPKGDISPVKCIADSCIQIDP